VQWNPKTKTIADANVLLSAVEKESFLVALVIYCNVFRLYQGPHSHAAGKLNRYHPSAGAGGRHQKELFKTWVIVLGSSTEDG